MEPAIPYAPSRSAVAALRRARRGRWADWLRGLLRRRESPPHAQCEAGLVACFADALTRVHHDLYFLTEATPDLRAASRVQAHATHVLASRLASHFGLDEAAALAVATVVVEDYARQAQAAPVRVGSIDGRLADGTWTFTPSARGGAGGRP